MEVKGKRIAGPIYAYYSSDIKKEEWENDSEGFIWHPKGVVSYLNQRFPLGRLEI